MASTVDIYNLALSHLGDGADVVSTDEQSQQATLCNQFYPIARDSLLELAAWTFATRRAAGAAVTCDRDEWGFAYAIPNLAIRILGVFAPGTKDEGDGEPFMRELNESNTEVIYTDTEDAVIKYTISVTDTTRFPPLFVQALSWHLAAMLAGPIIKGDAGQAEAKRCEQTMVAFLSKATASNLNQSNNKPTHTAPWISGR